MTTVEQHIKMVEHEINAFFATNPTPKEAKQFLEKIAEDVTIMLTAMNLRFGNPDRKFGE